MTHYKVEGKNVLVPIDIFKELIETHMKMECLERDGVDNWEWYGESFDLMGKWIEEWNEENPEIKIDNPWEDFENEDYD